MSNIKIIDRSFIDIGRPATQEDVTQMRNAILKREISLTKPLGFELRVHGQKSDVYMLERGQTTLEAIHEISLQIGRLTMLKTSGVKAVGYLKKGLITSTTLARCLMSGGEPLSILEEDMPLFTLRNNASLTLFLRYKSGEHFIAQSARALCEEVSAYVCQPDFTLANYVLVSPVLGNDGKMRCTISANINVEYVETLLSTYFTLVESIKKNTEIVGSAGSDDAGSSNID